MARFLVTVLALVLFAVTTQSQENLIRNGTFAASKSGGADIYPAFWTVCQSLDVNDPLNWNDPTSDNIYVSADGSLLIEPIHGNTLIKFRSRGRDYFEQTPKHPPLTREYITQRLLKPLNPYTYYKFSIFACYSPSELFVDINPAEMDKAYPMKLNILVGNDSCIQDRMLLETLPISNTSWQQFDYYFNTFDKPFQYLRLTSMWDTINIKDYPYNGMVLLDSARLEKICDITTDTVVVDYLGDGLTQLLAPEGASGYEWSPKQNLSAYNTQKTTMLKYMDSVMVLIKYPNTCPTMRIYKVKLDCDLVYPDKITDTINVFYRKDINVVLPAKQGIKYSWNPSSIVSDSSKQNPYLLYFTDFVTASIIDYYKCESKQVFSIKINCDLLNPDPEISILDTLVQELEEITLKTRYGTVSGNWTPEFYLSCIDCQMPVAAPKSTTTYKVKLLDEFNCQHFEKFKLEVKFDIHNFISPNGDSSNECFHVSGLPEKTTLTIYDKSGRILNSIYPYNNDDNCWGGKDSSGKLLESGNYWYSLESPYLDKPVKGFVFVKR